MFDRIHPPSLILPPPRLGQRLRRTLVLLAYADRFTQLERWASRRRLGGPRQAYRTKLQRIEGLLCWQRRQDRGLVILCEFLYTAYQQLTATASARARGWAARPSARRR